MILCGFSPGCLKVILTEIILAGCLSTIFTSTFTRIPSISHYLLLLFVFINFIGIYSNRQKNKIIYEDNGSANEMLTLKQYIISLSRKYPQ